MRTKFTAEEVDVLKGRLAELREEEAELGVGPHTECQCPHCRTFTWVLEEVGALMIARLGAERVARFVGSPLFLEASAAALDANTGRRVPLSIEEAYEIIRPFAERA